MSHHGNEPFDKKFLEQFRKMEGDQFRGALGDHPEGKLTKSDEGAIQFAIGHENGKVVLDFGTQVTWVGMNPKQAVQLAESLLDHARKCSDEALTFKIG